MFIVNDDTGKDQLNSTHDQLTSSWNPFHKGPEKFLGLKAIAKILNIMFPELFFSHNFNANKVNLKANFIA